MKRRDEKTLNWNRVHVNTRHVERKDMPRTQKVYRMHLHTRHVERKDMPRAQRECSSLT